MMMEKNEKVLNFGKRKKKVVERYNTTTREMRRKFISMEIFACAGNSFRFIVNNIRFGRMLKGAAHVPHAVFVSSANNEQRQNWLMVFVFSFFCTIHFSIDQVTTLRLFWHYFRLKIVSSFDQQKVN